MKIGVTSYSFSKYIKETGCDYIKICDIAKEIGFSGIEFIDLDNKGFGITSDPLSCAAGIRAHCDKIGLEIIAYTVGANLLCDNPDAEVKRLCACVDVANVLGAKVMRHDVCWSLPKKPLYSYRDAIDFMAPYIRQVSEYARGFGIRTCTENHGVIFQSPERVEELILKVGCDNYGWLCDFGNFLCADADIVRAVTVAAPYTFHAHAKDFLYKPASVDAPVGFFETAGGNLLRGTVLGHGVVPISNCVKILKKAGYDGWLSVEFEGAEDNITALKNGFEFLKRYV